MESPIGPLVSEFNRLARRYFALIESQPVERIAWLAQIQLAVVDLYAAALRLPKTEPSEFDAPGMRNEDQQSLMDGIFAKLGGDHIFYSFVFDPLQDTEPVGGLLSEDLSSSYADLYDGTALLDAGAVGEDAVWAWRLGFESHWGQHALGALQALKGVLAHRT